MARKGSFFIRDLLWGPEEHNVETSKKQSELKFRKSFNRDEGNIFKTPSEDGNVRDINPFAVSTNPLYLGLDLRKKLGSTYSDEGDLTTSKRALEDAQKAQQLLIDHSHLLSLHKKNNNLSFNSGVPILNIPFQCSSKSSEENEVEDHLSRARLSVSPSVDDKESTPSFDYLNICSGASSTNPLLLSQIQSSSSPGGISSDQITKSGYHGLLPFCGLPSPSTGAAAALALRQQEQQRHYLWAAQYSSLLSALPLQGKLE